MRLAALQVRGWEAEVDRRARGFRSAERRSGVHRATQLQRCCGEVLRGALQTHGSLGTLLLAPVAAFRPRWQRWLVLGTSVLAVFTVNVWLFYEKRVDYFSHITQPSAATQRPTPRQPLLLTESGPATALFSSSPGPWTAAWRSATCSAARRTSTSPALGAHTHPLAVPSRLPPHFQRLRLKLCSFLVTVRS